MSTKEEILGVDLGGVILDFVPSIGTEVAFDGENYLETPVVADAIQSLKTLNESRFARRIFIVSRYLLGPERSLAWLRHQDFFACTGIPESHVYQCAERHEKETICRELKLTHFADDRAEVLRTLLSAVPNLYLFQELDEDPTEFSDVLPKVRFVRSWRELLPELQKA